MKENKVYHMNFLDNKLKDKCAKTIIADPPYFEVKGKFDYIWDSFADYLKDVELWAVECKRILADNGTLFWYGDRKKIAYSQIILDKYFNLEENITIHIFDRQTNRIPAEDATSFINVTEHLLMYSNGDDYHDTVRLAIKNTQEYLKTITTRNDFAESLLKVGNCKNIASAKQNANNILSQKSAKPQLITELQYDLINNKSKKPYEELRHEYEELRRPFNVLDKYKTNVLRISQEGHKTGKFDHDTVKPEFLSRLLIDATTNKNDLVVVPFAGSGTECEMAQLEGRKFYGFDIEKKYVDMANNRCRFVSSTLF